MAQVALASRYAKDDADTDTKWWKDYPNTSVNFTFIEPNSLSIHTSSFSHSPFSSQKLITFFSFFDHFYSSLYLSLSILYVLYRIKHLHSMALQPGAFVTHSYRVRHSGKGKKGELRIPEGAKEKRKT